MVPAHDTLSAPASLPALAPLAVMPLPALVSFQRLMRDEGVDVDLQRMCIDDAYAFDCLVSGHCSSDDRLRQAALGLFAAYQRNAAPSAGLH